MKSLLRYYFSVIAVAVILFGRTLYGQTAVVPIGPDGGISNVVRGMANDSVVLVGTPGHGIYRSLDGGANWVQTSLSAATVNDIVFRPNNSLVVYAATNQGLYVSADAGATWNITLLNTPVSTLAIYPSNTSIMFAGDGRPSIQSRGILRTVDGGATAWTQVVNGLVGSLSITSLVIDPASPAAAVTVYAGTADAGVYQSINGGNSWNAFIANNGLNGQALRIHCLGLVQSTVLTAGTSSGQYVCLGGAQWLQFTGLSIDDRVVQCAAIVGNQAASARYYVGTKGNEEAFASSDVNGGLYFSSNFGTTWALRLNASIEVNSIFIPSSNTKKIYLATSDGIYVTADTGKSWLRQNAGMMNSLVRSVAVMNANPQYLFAAVFGGGVHRSTDGGLSWLPSPNGLKNPYVRNVITDPKNSAVLFAATVAGIYKSVDTASSWKKIPIDNIPHDSLSPYNNNFNQVTIKISPVSSNNLMAGALTGEFAKSSDGGLTWSSIVPPQGIDSAGIIEKFEFDPVNASTIYFTARGIWKSTDFGTTWTSIAGDLPTTLLTGGAEYSFIGVHPRLDSSNVNVLYLPMIVNSQSYAVFKTTNGGVHWVQLNVKGFDVGIDKLNPASLVCAGPEGIFQSSDAGQTWAALATNPLIKYSSITVGSFAALVASQASVDFGAQQIGTPLSKNVIIQNIGSKSVTVKMTSSGSSDFALSSGSSSQVIDPGKSGTFTILFTPKSAGALQGVFTFAPDPPSPHQVFIGSTSGVTKLQTLDSSTVSISLRGSGVAKILVTRSVLLETTHGISSGVAGGSITNYFSKLVQALQQSGITVTQNQAAFDPFAVAFDAILIAAPKKAYSDEEVSRIRKYVVNGGLLVMLGDSGKSDANLSINSILGNYLWEDPREDAPNIPTGIALNYDVVYDSTKYYLGAQTSPLLSAFVDTTHPFVKGVTSIVPFASSSITVSAGAVSFLNGNTTTSAIASDTTKKRTLQPTVVALSQFGKGRILVIGDVDMWGNGTAVDSTIPMGLLAGKNLQFALNVFGYVDNYAVKLPKPTPSDKYQIISIPFDLTNFNILDVLKDLGTIDKTKWRLYGRWTGTEYLEYPTAAFLSFKRGEGYWLITKGEHTLSLGSAKLSTAQQFYPIKLDSGYNLIGNPFPYRVSWATSQRPGVDSVEQWLWSFNGAGFQKEENVMEPFTGYFLKSLRSGVTVYINPTEVTSPTSFGKAASGQRQLSPGEWELSIRASNGVATDDDNAAGVLASSSDEWDGADYSEPPPAPTDYLMLSFNHKSWKNNPGRYAGDFQAIHPDGNFWDFDIASAKPEATVSVQVDELGTVPPQFEIYLVDMRTERVNDIHTAMSYNFTLKKNESVRSFRLVVGTKEFVEKNTNGIPLIPLDNSLDQNFPNPFNPSTQIRFTLGHSAAVHLEVFNVLGQKVRTLLNEVRPIGTHSIEWDGTNDRGMKVSSGIFFYRIRTEEFSSSKKMVLLK